MLNISKHNARLILTVSVLSVQQTTDKLIVTIAISRMITVDIYLCSNLTVFVSIIIFICWKNKFHECFANKRCVYIVMLASYS